MNNGMSLLFIMSLLLAGCQEQDAGTSGSPVASGLATGGQASSAVENGVDIGGKSEFDVPILEGRVIQNCYLVRDAAEAWARESGGQYPDSPWDESPLGNTLYDLLPNGEPLMNPFTGRRSEPSDGHAVRAGETGYVRRADGPDIVGYFIMGCGREDGIVIIMITKGRDPETDESNGKVTVRAQKM